MRTPDNLPLALIEWHDANTSGDDAVTRETVDSYHKHTVVRTLGWVLKQDDAGITIVTEFYDSTYRGRTFIPAAMVVSVTHYILSKKRAKHATNNTNVVSIESDDRSQSDIRLHTNEGQSQS